MQTQQKDIGQYANHLNNMIRRQLDITAKNNHINGAQGRVLIYLLIETRRRDVFQKDIEEKYAIRPSSASAMLKKMENAGLIVRQPLPSDNRLKRIIPTARAKEAEDGVVADTRALEQKMAHGIPEADLTTFFDVIDKIIANLS